MDPKLVVRYAIRETSGIVAMGVALFWSAGMIDWWPAWAALSVMLAWIAATAIGIFRINSGLLAERLGPRKGAKPWDTAILSVLGFTQLIRYIQSEQGHIVTTSGPYHYVRHPAYAGVILYELAVPILLASGWACIPSGVGATLLILPTALEDRTLQVELAGYVDYSRQVRSRLVPGIW